MDFCGKAINIITGSLGLAIVLRSDTPSGKGRAIVKKDRKKDQDIEGNVGKEGQAEGSGIHAQPGSAEGSAIADPMADLPAAPSDFFLYECQAASRAHMMTDYLSLLRLGQCVEGRFAQPCSFRYTSREHVQAIAVQPTSNAAWQRSVLFDQ